MTLVAHGDFEWDDAKADANLAKHGVPFEEVSTAFEDPSHQVWADGVHIDRYILIGFSHGGRLLTVVHVERGERERIISAWRATAGEERLYTGR